MSKLILGLLVIILIVLLFLLFWIVVLSIAFLLFGRKKEKMTNLKTKEGFT